MKDANAKRYYKKINTTFIGLNEVDEFAKIFINVLKSGDTTLYQKERRERRVFDDSWMTSVEEAIPVIDRITRSPRENLKKVQQVVPVERAKRIDQDTIRHLAAHSENIKSINRKGEVIPSKVMTTYNESDFGTYENRFIKTLVDKLYIFIEKRYDLIVKKLHTEYVNFLNIKSQAEWNNANIEFDVTLKINQNLSEDEVDRKNQELFDRMTHIRTNITNFKMSNFMNDMKQFPPVSPPIMKTNVIMKNPDFRACYDLWLLMDSIDQIGFDIDVYERDIQFNDKYLDQLYTSLMVLYSTLAYNQKEEFLLSQENPFEYRSVKRPKLSKNNPMDIRIEPGYIQVENNQLNQYFLEQVKKTNYARLKTLRDAGITTSESVEIIFKQIGQITNAVYEDYIQQNFNIENKKTIEEKIDNQEKILDMYRMVEKIKRDDLRSLTTNRAIALLQLRNLRDELKAKQEADKLEQERLKEEKRIEREKAKARKEQEKIQKEKRIEREKANLEKMKLERAEKRKQEQAKKQAKLMKEKELEKAKKEKARLALKEKKAKEKEKALEALRLQKAKETEAKKLERLKEQARIKAEKQKQLEKERKEKQKARDAEKKKIARQKEREKEKLKKQKELEKQHELEAKQNTTPKKKKVQIEEIGRAHV